MDGNQDILFTSDLDMQRAFNSFDEFLEENRGKFESDEQRVTMLNALKLMQIDFAYKALKFLLRGSDAKVTCELYKPFKTMGSVSAEGETLEFLRPEWFARIAEFANSTEVYPLVNNKIRLTFTFHGLTKPIE